MAMRTVTLYVVFNMGVVFLWFDFAVILLTEWLKSAMAYSRFA